MKLLRPLVIASLLLLARTAPSLAQSGFGTNKILYQPLHWLVADSPHVQLYFYPEEAALARSALALAESTCVEYERRLSHHSNRPIPIFLYSSHRDFESTNILSGASDEETGGVTELLRGRVLVPHTGSFPRLVHVMRHELAHAYMLDMLGTAARRDRAVLRGTPPLWIVEGWAEHLSGGWTADDDMVLRTSVLDGAAVPVDETWRIEGSFLMYKEGQSFLDWIAPTIGGTAGVAKLFDAWPKHPNFEECAKVAWGVDLDSTGRLWFSGLKRRYYPLVASRHEASDFARALPAPGAYNLRPAVVPGTAGDSLKLVHFSSQGSYPGLWLWERHGLKSEETRLVRAGNKHAYESLHFFQTRLSVSRRGEVAVVSRQGARDVLHILGLKDGDRLATFQSPDLVGLSSPCWSPGGDSLVIRGQSLSGDADVYLVDRRTGDFTQLTHDSFDDLDPIFSPDGRSVTFCSDRTRDGRAGHYHIFQRDPSGAITALVAGPGSDLMPHWSPDGRSLAFVSDSAGIHDLYMYRAGKGVAALTRLQGAAWDPCWEGDSRRLVFSQYGGGKFAMFEMDVVDSLLEWKAPEPRAVAEWQPDQASEDTRIGPYRRKWGIGLVQSSFGTTASQGAGPAGQLALQDFLGNEEFDFYLNSSSEGLSSLIQNLDIGATYFNMSRRLNFGAGLFRLNQVYDSRLDLVRTEHRTGALVNASYPLTRFDRLQTSLIFRHTENHFFSDGTVGAANLLSHYMTFVHDNAWYGEYGFSAGWRFLVSGGQTRDLRRGKGNFWSLTAEARRYQQLLPGLVAASRVRADFVTGEDAEPVFGGGFGDLPGYLRRSLRGSRVLVLNQEIRFPVVRSLILSVPGGGLVHYST